MVSNWQNKTYTPGDHVLQHEPPPATIPQSTSTQYGLQTPANTSVVENYACRDFVLYTRPGIKLIAPQQHAACRAELIFNVDVLNHNIQPSSKGNLSGLSALQMCLARTVPGRIPTFNELCKLLVSAGYDLKGRSLPAQALWAVLSSHGTINNAEYRLGVVNGGCTDPDSYDIYVYAKDSNPQSKIIWLYNDNVERVILGRANTWSAIAPDNVHNDPAPLSWAAVVKNPAPPVAPPTPMKAQPPQQVQGPAIDKSRLHPNYMNMSIRPKDPQLQRLSRAGTPQHLNNGRRQRGTPKPATEASGSYQCGECGNYYATQSQFSYVQFHPFSSFTLLTSVLIGITYAYIVRRCWYAYFATKDSYGKRTLIVTFQNTLGLRTSTAESARTRNTRERTIFADTTRFHIQR
jgi:hypothetical protein